MTPEFIKQTAETIRQQLFGLTALNVICSWGIELPLLATIVNGMAALKFKVDARLHKGYVIIALNEGVDYYELFLQKQGEKPERVCTDLDFTQLGDIIDEKIESGTDKAEYDAFCEAERRKLFADLN